jgi:hypothetical protein
MNVEIGTEAAQFPEKEYINGIFVVILMLKVFWAIAPVKSPGICCKLL